MIFFFQRDEGNGFVVVVNRIFRRIVDSPRVFAFSLWSVYGKGEIKVQGKADVLL